MNALSLVTEQPRLTRFIVSEVAPGRDHLVTGLTAGIMALCLIMGAALMLVEVPARRPAASSEPHRVRIRFDAVSATVATAPKPVVTEPTVEREIPRLEPQTILAAPEDRATTAPVEAVAVTLPATVPEETAPAPRRRVYGVRKVYAKGLGTGEQGAGSLVTKRGNILGGAPDSLTATAADLRGTWAPLSTVDQAPRPLHRVKPDYSPAMRQARVSGVVAAYLLVAVDGSVKDVKITADIGWDSGEVAAAALRRFRFGPALRDGQPVAVWILHRIRFVFQE